MELLVARQSQWVGAALARPALRDVDVVEVAQVLDEMVPPRESLFTHARAVFHGAREVGLAHAVNRGLVPLQICKPREVGGGCAVGDVALPSSAVLLVFGPSRGGN